MATVDQNKHTFFEVVIKSLVDKDVLNPQSDLFHDLMDDFVARVNLVDTDFSVFYNKEKCLLTYIFKVEPRKRLSFIRKCCDYVFPTFKCEYSLEPLTRDQKTRLIDNLLADSNIDQVRGGLNFDYTAKDIELFKDKDNFFAWQIDLYEKIFSQDGNIKPIESRKIISIVDPIGKSGKSTFVKYLCYIRSDFVKLSYGSSMQLRSAILNVGPKKCYLIDLPRTSGINDRKEDILSVIEELKNGHITSPMYGKYANVLMDPPIVIVFSNLFFPYDSLSADRWDCYIINKDSLSSPKLVSLGEREIKRKYAIQQEEIAKKKFINFLVMEERQKLWEKEFRFQNQQEKSDKKE